MRTIEPEAMMADLALPVGRRYDSDGRQLLLDRAGTGGPAVVFLPGAGMVGLDYLNVHLRIAEFTTSVIYDRAGTGWSDPAPLPRSGAEVATELRSLLRVADIPGPYVLAGHSLGGLYSRRFAQLFPEDVAGLLFLDPGHEDYPAHMPDEVSGNAEELDVPEPDEATVAFFRGLFESIYAAWPDDARTALVDYHVRAWRQTAEERGNLETKLYPELRDGGEMPGVPRIVLTAMGIDPLQKLFLSEEVLHKVNAVKPALYSSLGGEHRLIDGAGHSTMHADRPEAVIEAARDLVLTST
ncbi:alpha/beta hydrolase [Allokutzneria sp. A3M-2-11 16]|uniref:alpha/beta hydrolase n=1 Tax=Allokutzneria sp. A3M-2-11 16 TaxID=2962043 RepID=UPI0020B6D089|nr:alpha/beta hydrolase [Allokutzneria sp. A3M-2-11 16]MCP3798368.1 alpha/beta hydrolase [Allokutzneria sp. A3M-2-11 16]